MDQRICIKFCVKNKIKCSDTIRMLTVAYGVATMDQSNVYRWYKMFSEGREDVNDEERAGRQRTSITDKNINEVRKLVLANRRISVREVAKDLNISIGSCHSIFTNNLGLKRVPANFVPKPLKMKDKPKRPLSAYMLWLNSARDSIKQETPGIKITEVPKRGRELWRAMKDKSAWEAKAAQAKEIYMAAVRKFDANGGGGTSAANGSAKKRGKVIKKVAKNTKKSATITMRKKAIK